jgi:drug/metabolite transporter superfamily protein YnfA
MMRFVLYLLFFLAPFALYGLYLLIVKRLREEYPGWEEAPWSWLIIAGLSLAIIGFLLTSQLTGEAPGGTYIPPHEVGGKIVPGEVRR